MSIKELQRLVGVVVIKESFREKFFSTFKRDEKLLSDFNLTPEERDVVLNPWIIDTQTLGDAVETYIESRPQK